jgi:hypothetical protein
LGTFSQRRNGEDADQRRKAPKAHPSALVWTTLPGGADIQTGWNEPV